MNAQNDPWLSKLIKTKLGFSVHISNHKKKSNEDLDTLLGGDALKTEFSKTELCDSIMNNINNKPNSHFEEVVPIKKKNSKKKNKYIFFHHLLLLIK